MNNGTVLQAQETRIKQYRKDETPVKLVVLYGHEIWTMLEQEHFVKQDLLTLHSQLTLDSLVSCP